MKKLSVKEIAQKRAKAIRASAEKQTEKHMSKIRDINAKLRTDLHQLCDDARLTDDERDDIVAIDASETCNV